MTGPIAQ